MAVTVKSVAFWNVSQLRTDQLPPLQLIYLFTSMSLFAACSRLAH